jgi:acyl-CoA thioesterase YciA
MTSETPPAGEPALRAIAMPADANPNGDIFGGWLLAQMDLAGGNAAKQRAKGRVATVGLERTISVETWVRRGEGSDRVRVTQGVFTYVAIDTDRRPRPVPPA